MAPPRFPWNCLVAALLCGCPLPEDQFVLSGRVTDAAGSPRADVEVRLLRNQLASETRCDALEPLDTTRTDESGHYSFTLIRQQVTRGVNARRFFRVETELGLGSLSQTFWFPDADLALGDLSPLEPGGAWRITETRLDDRIAWRAEQTGAAFQPDRAFEWRVATTLRDWRTVPVDSLGRYDIVPVEWRQEGAWETQVPGGTPVPPASRGAECPDIDVTPCPLTDGRYLPFEFPPNTRTLVFNFKHEVNVSALQLHGLALARTAVAARLEFNFAEDFDNWNSLSTGQLDTRLQELALERCNEPGVFIRLGAPGFIKPVLLRIAFLDGAGDLVPILSLAEVATR